MSSVEIYIVVEGQTEQTFVRDVLAEKLEINGSQIKAILEKYKSPEEINDDPGNAPSMRLEALTQGYRKVAMGKAISEAIGIQIIRKKCPHFNNWLTKFEKLATCR